MGSICVWGWAHLSLFCPAVRDSRRRQSEWPFSFYRRIFLSAVQLAFTPGWDSITRSACIHSACMLTPNVIKIIYSILQIFAPSSFHCNWGPNIWCIQRGFPVFCWSTPWGSQVNSSANSHSQPTHTLWWIRLEFGKGIIVIMRVIITCKNTLQGIKIWEKAMIACSMWTAYTKFKILWKTLSPLQQKFQSLTTTVKCTILHTQSSKELVVWARRSVHVLLRHGRNEE